MNFHSPDIVAEEGLLPEKEQDYHIGLEQSLIGYSLIEAAYADDVLRLTAAADYTEPLHRAAYEVIEALRSDQRHPDAQIVADVLGDEVIVDDVRTGRYLRECIGVARSGYYGATIAGLAEALRDAANRRDLAHVGNQLATAAVTGRNMIGDIATGAARALDDIMLRLRTGKPRRYTAGGAARIAMEHMDGTAPSWPTTGLRELDRMMGGYPRGQVTILAGRTGMGKTALALSSMLQTAKAGNASAMISMEMIGEQLGARMLTDLAYVRDDPISYDQILKRKISTDDTRRRDRLHKAQQVLDTLPIEIHQQRGLTLIDIQTQARKMAAQFERDGHRLQALYIDHIGLIRCNHRSENRNRQLAEISDGLSTLADELDVAIVALCQLNRAVESRENRRPALSDLKESGAIEEDARAVLLAYRPEYYLQKREDNPVLETARLEALAEKQNVLEIILAKNSNGPTGTCEAWCDIGANCIRGKNYGR